VAEAGGSVGSSVIEAQAAIKIMRISGKRKRFVLLGMMMRLYSLKSFE
jgi:hypothetical protein